MKKNNDYKQIYLAREAKDNYDLLFGKTVDKVAVCFGGWAHDTQHLVITFTDKTFISVGLQYQDDDTDRMELCDDYVSDPNWYHGVDTFVAYVDSNNKVRFGKYYKQLIDLGLWEVDADEVAQIIARQQRERDMRDWQLYLSLKEKFEDRDRNQDWQLYLSLKEKFKDRDGNQD